MKAELKHLSKYFPYELKGVAESGTIHGIESRNNKFDGLTLEGFINECTPIMHPLENLVKEITEGGETFRPMFKLLQLVSNQQEIPSETIEYSINEGVYLIRVNYMGFYVILGYDSNDNSFRMIRNDKNVSVNNQLEAFELLYKWHFNIYKVKSINK